MTPPLDPEMRLRTFAEKATPGPWTVVSEADGADERIISGDADSWGDRPTLVYTIELADPTHDAAYIAAASPDVILGLLDRLDRLEAVEKSARRVLACGVGNLRQPYYAARVAALDNLDDALEDLDAITQPSQEPVP